MRIAIPFSLPLPPEILQLRRRGLQIMENEPAPRTWARKRTKKGSGAAEWRILVRNAFKFLSWNPLKR
jgi:hypothetical protein